MANEGLGASKWAGKIESPKPGASHQHVDGWSLTAPSPPPITNWQGDMDTTTAIHYPIPTTATSNCQNQENRVFPDGHVQGAWPAAAQPT